MGCSYIFLHQLSTEQWLQGPADDFFDDSPTQTFISLEDSPATLW